MSGWMAEAAGWAVSGLIAGAVIGAVVGRPAAAPADLRTEMVSPDCRATYVPARKPDSDGVIEMAVVVCREGTTMPASIESRPQ